LKLSKVYILSSLNSSFSYYSDIFYPELSMTFLNSFFVRIDAKLPSFYLSFKLNIDRIASINYSSDSGYLYLLSKRKSTWPIVQENQQTRIYLSFLGQQCWPIRWALFRWGFDIRSAKAREDPTLVIKYCNVNIVIVVLVK
jgi:hypothetical protein